MYYVPVLRLASLCVLSTELASALGTVYWALLRPAEQLLHAAERRLQY